MDDITLRDGRIGENVRRAADMHAGPGAAGVPVAPRRMIVMAPIRMPQRCDQWTMVLRKNTLQQPSW
jgi:hypothetical protein